MKLINKTKLPDAVLTKVLTAAGRAIGARTSKVLVHVKSVRSGYYSTTGFAVMCSSTRRFTKGKWIATDGGFIDIGINIKNGMCDPLYIAEQFYNTALHEWAHIKDFQFSFRPEFSHLTNGRRPKHNTRPEEIRAFNMVDDAKAKADRGLLKSRDDLILDLAISLEELCKSKQEK